MVARGVPAVAGVATNAATLALKSARELLEEDGLLSAKVTILFTRLASSLIDCSWVVWAVKFNAATLVPMSEAVASEVPFFASSTKLVKKLVELAVVPAKTLLEVAKFTTAAIRVAAAATSGLR